MNLELLFKGKISLKAISSHVCVGWANLVLPRATKCHFAGANCRKSLMQKIRRFFSPEFLFPNYWRSGGAGKKTKHFDAQLMCPAEPASPNRMPFSGTRREMWENRRRLHLTRLELRSLHPTLRLFFAKSVLLGITSRHLRINEWNASFLSGGS